MSTESKEDVRSIWRRSWIWGLYDFTSLRNQVELWLAKRPGEMQTFVECMCCYFDDTFHGQSLEHWCTKGFLNQAEVDVCRDFHHLAHGYISSEGAPRGDDRMILADPRWHHVVAAAQETWKHLRSIITSEEEREIMDACDKEQKSQYEA